MFLSQVHCSVIEPGLHLKSLLLLLRGAQLKFRCASCQSQGGASEFGKVHLVLAGDWYLFA